MSRRPLDRRALFASGAAAALLAATGVSAGPLPARGGHLRLAVSGAARDDSWTQGEGLFMRLARVGLIYETLTEIAADGTLRPDLATAWRSADAGRRWRFDLRRDAVFHDGAPFTAKDAAASLAAIGTARATGRFGVEVTLDRPDPALPFSLATLPMRPAHAPDAGIGTGLYTLRRFTPGQQLIADRTATHRKDGAAGWFDTVELVSIPAAPVRAQAVAEYLVDGADIDDATPLTGFDDIALFDGHAIARSIALPPVTGTTAPFDDLRAPLRWWLA
ncbi:peptide ABC transporter substrate-binding protein [Sulfitobacter albidus]|uniref:Peptide ABC transporter substrate-binding protein n=1 Tax=Sulfitobacter albidus TaxID=2829501 RepID=A0A975JD10_9RHOB|nr:ABC transporter substrate-binding protein [Sulfitobacter albidus]QUJ76216.1 peptide ABC transporter substrate-binding protein [Sulfitobacter albidus]